MALRFTPNTQGGNRLLTVVVGPQGDAATIAVGTVTTGAAGSSATVTNSGTSGAAVFDFAIPRGDTGATGGTGATGATGAIPWVTPPTAWLTATSYTATAPASVVTQGGETYVCAISHTSGTFSTDLAASRWVKIAAKGADGAGTGDVVGPASSVDGEIALYDSTTGKLIKRASTTGLLKASSGVLAAAVSGTDYAPATSGSAILKGNGSGGFSSAVAGTDYAAATVDLTAGAGLTGGGTLASNRTFTVGAGTGITVNADDVAIATAYQAVGKQPIYIPATAMVSRTTNGAAAGTSEMTTNRQMVKTLDFDTTTQEFAQFSIRMPKAWNESTITFIPVWSHASTTTNFGVVWALEAVAISNDDTLDVAWGTAGTSTDTGGTTNDLYEGPESSAITIGGTPAEGDTVYFQIKRNVSDGSDTMAIDARLHGVLLYITTNAATDA